MLHKTSPPVRCKLAVTARQHPHLLEWLYQKGEKWVPQDAEEKANLGHYYGDVHWCSHRDTVWQCLRNLKHNHHMTHVLLGDIRLRKQTRKTGQIYTPTTLHQHYSQQLSHRTAVKSPSTSGWPRKKWGASRTQRPRLLDPSAGGPGLSLVREPIRRLMWSRN